MNRRKFCSQCLSQLRRFSAEGKLVENPQKFRLLDRVFFPWEPHSIGSFARKLASDVLYHSPGDVVVVNKPYGVSCLGYKQPTGGVFKPSRYDQRADYKTGNIDEEAEEFFAKKSALDNAITLEKALPLLAHILEEPGLHFCIGLKRYVSGPVVLPCSEKAFAKLKQSYFHANSARYTERFMYRALAICMERPVKLEGIISGYATFQTVRNTKEYVFVADAKASKRALSGKYAVQGEMKYRVLDSGYGCTLVDIHFTKFSRHLPRLILSYLGCPILGDNIYKNRLIRVDGEPVVVEPKDRWRGKNQTYEPRELLHHLQVEKYSDIQNELPLLLTVYQSAYPQFGETKLERSTELIVRAKPPDHFHAMAKALNFDRTLHNFLERLDMNEAEEEPVVVGKDRAF